MYGNNITNEDNMNNLSLTIQYLESLAQKIEDGATAQMNNLQGRTLTINGAEVSHQNIKQIYDNAMEQFSQIDVENSKKAERDNQDERCFVLGSETDHNKITEIHKRFIDIFRCFTDILLTTYPTAKIQYGRACIGPNLTAYETKDTQTQQMLKKCSSLREIRGDGNCFVSAFTTRFLETLFERKAWGTFLDFIIEDGIDDSDVKSEIGETLMLLNIGDLNLEGTLQDNTKILPFIKYFRLLAADEMRKKSGQFEYGFRMDLQYNFDQDIEGKSYEDLISKYVLAMGADFSHTSITALCQRLDFSVNIIDPKLGSPDGKNILDHKAPEATFCRNGDHYFVLYTGREKPISIINTNNTPINNTVRPITIDTNSISTKSTSTQKPTELVFHCKIASGNTLFIRGDEKAGLSWKQGIPLKEKGDTWVFESSRALNDGEFKIIYNDDDENCNNWENWSGNRNFSDKNSLCQAPTFNLPKNLEILETPIVTTPVISTPITPIKIELKDTLPKISMIQFRIFTNSPSDKPFARGDGPGMENWTKGIELNNNFNGTWSLRFTEGSEFNFKILLNNNVSQYEKYSGNRHTRDKDGIKEAHFA